MSGSLFEVARISVPIVAAAGNCHSFSRKRAYFPPDLMGTAGFNGISTSSLLWHLKLCNRVILTSAFFAASLAADVSHRV
jgi:hypothetical protein